MKLLRFLQSIIINLLGIRVFNGQQKKLFLVEVFIFFGIAVANVFVNTFIMVGGGLRGVVIYNIFVFSAAGVASFLQAILAKRFGLVKIYRLGIILHILFYLSILVLGETVVDFIWLVGALSGASLCFFFVTRNMLILAYAEYDQDVESVYWGSTGMLNSVFTIVLPLLSGLLITFIFDTFGTLMVGYYIVFSFGIAVFLAGLILSFFMPASVARNTDSNLWQDAKVLVRNKSFIFSGLGEMFRGTRDVIGNFIFIALVFHVIQSEAMVGTYNMVVAICKLAGFYLVARYLNLQRAKSLLLAFAIVAAVTPLLLLFFNGENHLWALFVVGGAAFAVLSFQSAANVIISNAIRGYVECGFFIREIFLTIGRMIGLPLLLVLLNLTPNVVFNVGVAMVILGAMQILAWLMHSWVKFEKVK